MTEPHRSSLRSFRERIDRELNSFEWPVPFDIGVLLDQIAVRRGKPIALFPAELPAEGPGGLVVERRDDLVIVFDDRLPMLQQEHIIMHEVSHILFGHRGTTLDDLGGADELSELDPEVVKTAQRFARRHGYSQHEETEAEIAAALMWQRVGTARSMIPPRERAPEIAEADERFHAALTRARSR
ncbi:hypothetical protein SAMN04488074_101348 [Lentzea albidocapillata subsp. violacea]|uniref:IrrE N-terminal-like domain-containing protein n=1 Tax=Lentzea albidocapillata subsp. violacea TaxID=128104 RepID=A0A1G8QIS5_9PSEU|nr:hypothetical protein [Lentzea albidocapillata]SDJ04000.1 hypothetical protein SAMN04488074_101348 [Lentzea albidocapillata subsp. violacea]